MININVFRPADCNETVCCLSVDSHHSRNTHVICCSQSTVTLLQGSTVEKAPKGAYIAVEVEHPALILIAAGSEVGFCVSAAKTLTELGVATRVVSMPCQEVFSWVCKSSFQDPRVSPILVEERIGATMILEHFLQMVRWKFHLTEIVATSWRHVTTLLYVETLKKSDARIHFVATDSPNKMRGISRSVVGRQ